MSKNIALAVTLGTVTVAGIGYLWNKKRKAKLTEAPAAQEAAPAVKPEAPKEEPVKVSIRETLSLKPKVEVAKSSDPTPQVQEDIVTSVAGEDGEIASVSRVRVPGDCFSAPRFWSSFFNNIRREEVISLQPEDFLKTGTKPDLPKGYHKATMKGYDHPAIVHVTKGHVSAVVFLDGTQFVGYSTSASRFSRDGGECSDAFVIIDAKQAKDFLNGR